MPFQLILPWLVMLPMLIGSSLVSIPLFIAFLLAAIGLGATHIAYRNEPIDPNAT